MKFFNTYKKEVSTLLVLAFFHGFVFEAMATIARQTPLHPSQNVPYYVDTTLEELENQNDEQPQIESSVHLLDEEQEALWRAEGTGTTRKASQQKAEEAQAEKGAITTLYPSDMTHGEIGRNERNVFDAPDDNLFKVEIKDAIDFNASYTLTYEVYGIGNAAGVTKSINTNTSTGGFFIEKNKEWTRVTEFISPYSLRKGVNTVLFTSDLKTDLGYLIRNLQIEKEEGVQTDLVYINDAVKKTDANEVYVQGVLNTNDPELQLFIDGQEIAISNSGFEKLVAVDLETAKELFLEVKKGDITLEKKSVAVSKMTEVNHNKALDKAFEITNYEVNVQEEQHYQLENIAITLPAESYAENFKLSIQELRESDYAPTGMALKNVTKNKAAYRFLPDGIAFEKDATIKIKYDLTKLPVGYSAKDIQVFYFDTNLKQWTKVKVLDILEESGEVVASTNHFTDYIAGVIQEPESPEGNAFAPTTISGIQAANPTENIPMVSVPQINDRGDASLSFPLQLPPARHGMVPDLSVNYNSSSDEGDFGLGWSLSVPTLVVDTRWGVPTYDGVKETESYLLNGEELLMVKPDKTLYASHKDPLTDRVLEAKFQKMQHDPNLEITRKGSVGSDGKFDCYWEVYDKKKGWTYKYAATRGEFLIIAIVDDFRNSIEYFYGIDGALKTITYNNGSIGNEFPSYGTIIIDIHRKKTIDSPSKTRGDIKINNRYGYSKKSYDLIDKIHIYSKVTYEDIVHNRNFLTEYKFKYKEGKFGRSLLNKIIHSSYSNNGDDFRLGLPIPNSTPIIQEYSFDYHDDVGNGGLFDVNGKKINTFKDYETEHERFKVHISALGGGEGKSTSFSGGGSLGAVIPIFPNSYFPFSRSATLGGNVGGGNSNSEAKVLMADIDGDGLPDKIFKSDKDFYYRKNLGGIFSEDIFPVKKLPGLSYSRTNSTDDSYTVNILMGSVTRSSTGSVSTTSTYTTDVNADGLLDVVVNGRVHFGYIDPVTKLPTFSLDSSITPAIVMKEDDVAPVLNPMPQLDLTNGLMDVVMVWRAPKDGQVKVTGTITKQHIALQSGVKFSIEKLHDTNMGEATFVYGPHLMLSSSDSHDQTMNVVKGDLLFFRVHSNQMPVKELGITWNPKVEYLSQNFESSLGYSKYSSSYQESFMVGTQYEHTIKEGATYKLEWPSFSFSTNDRVNIRVSFFAKDTNGKSVPAQGGNVVVYDKMSVVNGSTTFASPNLILKASVTKNNPKTFNYVKVEVLSDSEVDWNTIDSKFKPKLTVQDNLPGREDVFLIPYYSNYSNVITNYANSDFTGYANTKKYLVNHSFSLPGCTEEICKDRYVYLIVKWASGFVSSYVNSNGDDTGYGKFRYKINANGAVVSKEWLDYNTKKYVSISDAVSTYGLGGFAGSKAYFEYYTSENAIAKLLDKYQNTGSNYLVRIEGETPKSTYVEGGNNYGMFKSNIYSSEMNTAWGSMFRNWGQFAYKGVEPGETYLPIKGEYIHVFNPEKKTSDGKTTKDVLGDTSASLDDVESDFDELEELGGNVSRHFAVLMPNKKNNRWESHEHLYVSKAGISPYLRFITDDIPELKPPTVPVSNYGAAGIDKYSHVKNKSFNKSLGFTFISMGDTKTEGSSELLNEFIDINGDGFPDIVGSRAQLTARRGGLSSRIQNVNLNTITQIKGSGSLIGGSSTGIKSGGSSGNSEGKMSLVVGLQGSGNVSGNSFNTTNEASRFYVDINGDGLVDIVEPNGTILLNYGGTFTSYSGSAWGTLPKQSSTTQTKGVSAGGGFSASSNMDISAGLSVSQSTSKDKVTYMDLNGDGLPEKIVDGSTYYINLGSRFDTAANILPGTQTQKSTEAGINGNGTVCIYFTIPIFFTGPKICVSLGGSGGKSYSTEESRYMDFDGDGFTDYVTSEKNESITVYSSRIKRTNLLKKVYQSTGSTIQLDYDMANPIEKDIIGGNYKMPYKKMALTKVTVYDGFVGDGEDFTRYAYEYFNGYKDRKERNFLGFGETRSHLLDKNGVPYRTNVTEYLNNDITEAQLYRPGISSDLKQYLYKKGMEKRTYTLDRTKRMLNESLYTYKFYDTTKLTADVNTTATSSAEVSVFTYRMSVLPLITSITNRVTSFDEDVQNSSLTKETVQKFNVYDKSGNVKKFLDVSRGVTVDMEYDLTRKTLVKSHRVSTTSGNQMLRMTKATSNDGINIHKIDKYYSDTAFNSVSYEYDDMGNITLKDFGNGLTYEYIYGDNQFPPNTNYPELINNSRMAPASIKDSYGNEMKFIYNSYGLPIKVIDFYNVEISYKYDQLNRLIEVRAPYDHEWTIRNEFVSNRIAITKHNIGMGKTLHTSMINDGLGRTLQIKKQVSFNNRRICGSNIGYFLSASGNIIYDEFGRAVENYLSSEEMDCPGTNTMDNMLRTYYTGGRIDEKRMNRIFDQNDRVVEELIFGTNAKTKTKYSFGQDRGGLQQFTQEVTLPEGNKSITYINGLGLTTSEKQMGPADLWTSYVYDQIGQVKEVKNALDQSTTYVYDKLGRTTQKYLPASGITKYKYDSLSNVIEQEDANGTKIEYVYVKDRLMKIIYPTIKTSFRYEKGGRLGRIDDSTGTHTFKYGKLGEVVEEAKMLYDNTGSRLYFTTKYKYDSWGRILEMAYPDKERLSYVYNDVGQLVGVYSDINQPYIEDAYYNHFGQPTYIKYGNGVEMHQEYDETERLRAAQLMAPSSNNPNHMNVFSRNVYNYDKNNNINRQYNDYSQHDVVNVGGRSIKEYYYDAYNRLARSTGAWEGLMEVHNYELNMAYRKDHSIWNKSQMHTFIEKNTGVVRHSDNSLDRVYEYADNTKPRLTGISGGRFDGGGLFDQEIKYLANGAVSSIKNVVPLPNSPYTVRDFTWDANGNITKIEDDGGFAINEYLYDGKGERVVKRFSGGSSVSVNGATPSNGMYGTDEVLYPSGNLVYNSSVYTQHYYANEKRIASRIGDSSSVNNFSDINYNDVQLTPHEGSYQNRGMQKQAMSSNLASNNIGGVGTLNLPLEHCKRQINVLLNVLYNSPEKSDCRSQILEIVNRHTRTIARFCIKYEIVLVGQPQKCLEWSAPPPTTDHCTALEEINTLFCIERTEDGMIIDPETGYIYDPNTGLPYDPITREPIDLGIGDGIKNPLQLDCYNKFLNYISYYENRDDKTADYFRLLPYMDCLDFTKGDCFRVLPSVYMENDHFGFESFPVKFCELNVPDIIEDPEEPIVEPVFPDIDLAPGVDDTWTNNPPPHSFIVANPTIQSQPVWWYHSDHLGSSSYITDILGKPVQYYEYLPFGEIMVQQSTNNIFENVYKFNGKELDEQTGYYYYGARYYDPGASIFMSVDPLAEKYPNINPYVYVANNPINFIDPDGRKIVPTGMTPAQRKAYDSRINEMRGTNKMFNTIYSSLESSSKTHTVGFGSTISVNGNTVPGQVSPTSTGSSVVFENEGSFNNNPVLFEEFFHAYQIDNGFDNSGLNLEFEAKVGTTFMNEGTINDDGMDFDFEFEIFDMALDNNLEKVNSKEFSESYKNAANKFSKYNRDNNVGTPNYKKETSSEPNNLKKMINETNKK